MILTNQRCLWFQLAPKQKIRIKLRSYWVPLIEDSCKQIMDAARNTNAKTMGPVPLPTKKRIYCVLKSPHVHKDARFHFEIRTHQRLIDILYPTAQTIDSLMQLDLPAGVDVEVKLWREQLHLGKEFSFHKFIIYGGIPFTGTILNCCLHQNKSIVPLGISDKIETIQRWLAWPMWKDDI